MSIGAITFGLMNVRGRKHLRQCPVLEPLHFGGSKKTVFSGIKSGDRGMCVT
jgi:hypothetical protein